MSFARPPPAARLCFVLVEVKRDVELRLARERFRHTRFVIEGLVGLRLKIGEVLSQARAALRFLISEVVKRTQRVFDALHRAERIFGIEV
jgi:hypothetical protein